MREIDKACLINLARRPGLAVAEKAGPRQRILAVRREETNNTLENRVVRHCCKLIRRAAERYLAFHHDVDIGRSPRKQHVSDFHRKAIRWNDCEELRNVGILTVPCKSPNYVLLQNPHYVRIWQAYVTLVKNEELRASVWRWQRRLWKDIATVGFSELVTNWVEQLNLPVKVSVVEDRVVGGARSFSQGCFINHDVLPGPYILGQSRERAGTLYVVDHAGLERLHPESEILLMNADFYLVWEGLDQRKVIPVYCRVLSNSVSESECLREGQDAINGLTPFYPEATGVVFLRPSLSRSRMSASLGAETTAGFWDVGLSINLFNWASKEEFKMDSLVEWLVR